MKSYLKPTFASLLAVIVIGLAVSAQAQDKKTNATAKTEAPAASAKAMPYGGTLSAVDKTAMTITVKKKTAEKTFLVTSSTKISKAGKPATLEDGVIGEDVGVSYVDADGGKAEAKSIHFGAKPAKASGEKSTKKEKKAASETNSPAKN